MKLPVLDSALKLDTVLAAAALALSTAATIAWSLGWNLSPDARFTRWGLFLTALILSGGLLHMLLAKLGRREHEARLYLERLCLTGDDGSAAQDMLPSLNPSSPWFQALERVKGTLQVSAARLTEAEHARSALEIRCRRSSSQYERMAKILAGISEPMIAVDQFDEIWLTNPSAEKLLGVDASGTEKRVLSQLVRCEKLVALLNDTRRRKVRTTRSDEMELETPEGEMRWFRITASSIPLEGTAGGESTEENDGVVAMLRDISAQKSIQRHNAEFVSAASHEMKTPLAGIKAYVELLADGDAEDEETREEFLKVINSQADRLQRLIDNLLNLARIEAGVVKVSKQAQSLNEILLEAFHVVQPSAEAKQIQLVQDLSSMYIGVLVDRDMMLQAAINLLSNAIKYTPVAGRVTLHSQFLGQEARFEVEDTGVGLSPEDCHKIFGKFYRVERNKGMAPGTGLGLPLAKHIVEEVHGGQLTVTSTLDVGSTFRVTIPAANRAGS